MNEELEKPIIGIGQLSIVTGIGRGTLRRQIELGLLKCVRINKRVLLFRQSDVRAWLESLGNRIG